MSEDSRQRVEGAVLGAATGLTLWLVETAVVAAVNADISGLAGLWMMAAPLARWGLAYLGLGALFGAAAGRAWWAQGLPWLILIAVGDRGLAPLPLYVVLAVLGTALALAWGRSGFTLAVLAVAALGLAGVGFIGRAAQPVPTTASGPDVVLIVLDTVRADHLGVYGYHRDTSPVIDRFAEGAVRFTRARSNASWTLPSHASLFTGLQPSEHGATASKPWLQPTETLASRFARAGYWSVGFSSNAWVSSGTELDQGFHHFRFTGDDGVASQLSLALALSRPVDLGGADAIERAREALAHDVPTFLFVNLLEAHEPYGTLPEADLNAFAKEPLDPTLGRTWVRDMARFWCACDGPAGELGCKDGHPVAPADRIQGTIDRYDAGIRYDDALVGQLLEHVDDDAIVVITSDHGELLGEYDGRLGHMVTLEPELLDVPLLVRAPGLPAAIDDRPISLSDIPALIDGLLDARPPPPRARWAVSESHPHRPSTVAVWEALFGCDCSPTQQHRRVVWDGEREGRRTDQDATGPHHPWLDRPFADGHDAPLHGIGPALEALGYVQ